MSRRVLVWTVAAAIVLAAAGLLLRGRGERAAAGSSVSAPAAPVAAESSSPEPLVPAGEARPPVEKDPSPSAEPAPDVPARETLRRSRVTGRVVDETGEPLRGIRVRAAPRDAGGRSGNDETRTVFTEADGMFRLEGVGEGPFVVLARAEGRRAAVVRDVMPGTENLEIVLANQTGFAGRILDAETGEAVRRFRVDAVEVSGAWRPTSILEADDGSFAISDLEEGGWTLSVKAEGYFEAKVGPLAVEASEMRTGLEIRLHRALTVRGTVVDGESGALLRRATIRHTPADKPWWLGSTATTDSKGAFELRDVSPGEVLRVRHEEFADASTERLGIAGERVVEGIVVRLFRGGGLEGIATTADGSPLAGGTAEVLLADSSLYEPSFLRKQGDLDRSGYFRILGLLPGRYEVEVIPRRARGEDENAWEQRTLRGEALVEAGKLTRVEFSARPEGGCTIRGRVLSGEKAVRGASVWILPEHPSRPAPGSSIVRDLHGRSRRDGSFEIRGVPSGQATIEVSNHAPGLAEVGSWRIEVPDSGELVFDAHFSGGEIRGRVVRASDRRPVAGASVSVSKESSYASERADTDVDGQFRVLGLEPGAYRLSVGVFGFDRDDSVGESLAPQRRGSVELRADETVTVDFALETGGVARVKVIAPTGRALPGEEVEVVPISAGAGFARADEGTSDGAGVARVGHLVPGRYYAHCSNAEYAWQRSEPGLVRAGEETEFRLELQEPVRVRVRVLGEGDAPVERASARFRQADREEEWHPGALTDRSGECLAFLPPGEYTLEADAEGYSRRHTPIQAGPSLEKEVVVRLRREAGRR